MKLTGETRALLRDVRAGKVWRGFTAEDYRDRDGVTEPVTRTMRRLGEAGLVDLPVLTRGTDPPRWTLTRAGKRAARRWWWWPW